MWSTVSSPTPCPLPERNEGQTQFTEVEIKLTGTKDTSSDDRSLYGLRRIDINGTLTKSGG